MAENQLQPGSGWRGVRSGRINDTGGGAEIDLDDYFECQKKGVNPVDKD